MTGIFYHEKEKVFVLQTKNSMYQIQIGKYGILLHLYYGAPIGKALATNRIVERDRGFSGNPNEAGHERTFSLDVQPQEYAAAGNGDYRPAAVEAELADGSGILDLRYASHRIYNGKYALTGLPAIFAGEKEAQTLEIFLKDEVSGLVATLYYGVLEDTDIITRAVKLTNEGKKEIIIRRALSAQLDFVEGDMDFIRFWGKHAMERQLERSRLHHGIQSVGSTRGASSHHYNPFVILCGRDTNEDYGECYGLSFLYSGNFLVEAEVDQTGQTRVVAGIHPQHFAYQLKDGESLVLPEAVLAFAKDGLTHLSQIYHDVFREHLSRSVYTHRRRPILVNNWEATYFDFNEEKLLGIAKRAKEIGIEMLVMDDGWFGKRNDDRSGLGDWVVNEEKLKGGLPALVKRVNALGLKFGLWLEPEMISEDSDLYRAHPDWCLRAPDRPVNRSRSQLNLDITRPLVRDYILEKIFQVLDDSNVEYIKWDMNRSLSNVYSPALYKEQQGEVYHRYVLGLYDMLERLTARYPQLLLETCSGGGGRFDAGMLYYSPQIWCSDNTDAMERLKIQYGTSFGYPISMSGSHVSASPNHQTGRSTSFQTRGVVATAGTFGYELDLEKLTEEEIAIAKRQIEEYKKAAPLVLDGDYFRLAGPSDKKGYTAWQFVSKDKRNALIGLVVPYAKANPAVLWLRMKGLEPEATYQLLGREGLEGSYTGAELMNAGIPLPELYGDYQAMNLFLEKE